MLQIHYIDFLLTAIVVFNNETCYNQCIDNCIIYSNTFRLTRSHTLLGATISILQLRIGVNDNRKMFADFEINIKYLIDNAK